tara:strand:+ start:1397 stop:1804 length:408 start_codon:yes stop_codon:yes gene_type:complete
MFKSIETEISFALTVWGISSMVGGLTFLYFDNPYMSAIGFQFLIWGLVDTIIALGPSIFRKIRRSVHVENLKKLKKILIINSILDLGYILIGILIFIGIFNINEYNGHGIGVIIQGSFLAIFDTYYAVKIKAKGF